MITARTSSAAHVWHAVRAKRATLLKLKKEHGATNVRLIGSVARGDAEKERDGRREDRQKLDTLGDLELHVAGDALQDLSDIFESSLPSIA